ncbi:MAG: ribosome biogenesis GTPase Der, partial [Deltaproteobacteria bacterium]|nr:ribosome biogenesis GTPase Der [Deltaproteobacteria bacterium]
MRKRASPRSSACSGRSAVVDRVVRDADLDRAGAVLLGVERPSVLGGAVERRLGALAEERDKSGNELEDRRDLAEDRAADLHAVQEDEARNGARDLERELVVDLGQAVVHVLADDDGREQGIERRENQIRPRAAELARIGLRVSGRSRERGHQRERQERGSNGQRSRCMHHRTDPPGASEPCEPRPKPQAVSTSDRTGTFWSGAQMSKSGREGPPLVAIVGRANVGKSTLFNRLLRESRSLVEDRPGVTRDRVASLSLIEGREVLLVDTGGLDPEAELGIPAAIRRQVDLVVADAAVIVFVVDARDGVLPGDQQIAELLRRAGPQVVVVANKADNPKLEAASAEFHRLGFPEIIPTSAAHARGLVDLEIAIAERLPASSEPVATERRAGPPRLAIVGRPNVGKSSLLNALLGEERNIVADEPGTTRDSTDSFLRVDEREVVLVDTAGMRKPGRRSDRLERGSALMALRTIERADVGLLVLDAETGVAEQDAKIARLALDRGRPLVLVLNKWDTIENGHRGAEVERQLERRLGFVPEPVIVRTSAITGRGLARLLPEALR